MQLSEHYIQTIEEGGGLEGTLLLELNPFSFGTIMKENILTMQGAESQQLLHLSTPTS